MIDAINVIGDASHVYRTVQQYRDTGVDVPVIVPLTCVGISELASDAHFGVLVEDRWQCRGVGTQLMKAVVDEAALRNFGVLHADILTDDASLLGALRRIGPLIVSDYMEALSVDIKIARREE
jgi:GNAT superfamily N-acetyltransferase